MMGIMHEVASCSELAKTVLVVVAAHLLFEGGLVLLKLITAVSKEAVLTVMTKSILAITPTELKFTFRHNDCIIDTQTVHTDTHFPLYNSIQLAVLPKITCTVLKSTTSGDSEHTQTEQQLFSTNLAWFSRSDVLKCRCKIYTDISLALYIMSILFRILLSIEGVIHLQPYTKTMERNPYTARMISQSELPHPQQHIYHIK